MTNENTTTQTTSQEPTQTQDQPKTKTARKTAPAKNAGRPRLDGTRVITVLKTAAEAHPSVKGAGYKVLHALKAKAGLKVTADQFYAAAKKAGVDLNAGYFQFWADHGAIKDPAHK